jgi:hypothetical protein
MTLNEMMLPETCKDEEGAGRHCTVCCPNKDPFHSAT